jgi:hypothetical protein
MTDEEIDDTNRFKANDGRHTRSKAGTSLDSREHSSGHYWTEFKVDCVVGRQDAMRGNGRKRRVYIPFWV